MTQSNDNSVAAMEVVETAAHLFAVVSVKQEQSNFSYFDEVSNHSSSFHRSVSLKNLSSNPARALIESESLQRSPTLFHWSAILLKFGAFSGSVNFFLINSCGGIALNKE